MKKLIFLILLIISLVAAGQGPFPPVTSVGQPKAGYLIRGVPISDSGYQYRVNFPDTGTANFGLLDRVPGLLIRVNDTLWSRSEDISHWVKQGGGGGGAASSVQAAWALTKSNDSIYNGGNTAGLVTYHYYNTLIEGGPQTYTRHGNRVTADSLTGYGPFTQSPLFVNTGAQSNTSPYGTSMDSWSRTFAEEFGDTMQFHQYGAITSVTQRYVLDSTNSIFGPTATKKWFSPGDVGYLVINQFFPPKDSLDVALWQDGMTGSSFDSDFGLGATWGFNIHIGSGTPTDYKYPYATGYTSTTDLMRQNSRTRMRHITGDGFTGFLANYRTWQQTMTLSTPAVGHYISMVTGYHDVGPTDYNIGSALTKAQILAIETVDTVSSFVSNPLWRVTNTVKNGYSFRAMGDSDVLFSKGYVYLGSQLPTHDNGLWPQYRFTLIGDGKWTGVLYGYNSGRIFGQSTQATYLSPTNLFIMPPSGDTIGGIFIGSGFGQGAALKTVGKFSSDAVAGGIDFRSDYQYNADAGPRFVYTSGGTAIEKRYLFSRRKFYVDVTDSIVTYSPVYKLMGVPTGAQAFVLMQDANGLTYKADTSGLFRTASLPINNLLAATGTNDINNGAFGQVWRWNSKATGTGLSLGIDNTLASGNSQAVLELVSSGANANPNEVTYGARFYNLHSGTGSINIAAHFEAINGATNYAAVFHGGIVQFGNSGVTTGIIEMDGSTSGAITIQSANAAGTYTLTLPTTDGNANEFLQTNGSGVLTWATASSTVTWNSIQNPTGDQALTFDAGESSTWTNSNTTEDLFTVNSSTVTNSKMFVLATTSTAKTNGNALSVHVSSGANSVSGITVLGDSISITNTGTGSINRALFLNASGGGTNQALIVPSGGGRVGIGTSTPNAALEVSGTGIIDAIQTLSVGANSNFFTATGGGSTSTTSSPYLYLAAANAAFKVGINGTTSTVLSANHVFSTVEIAASVITEATSGTHPLIASLVLLPPTVSNGAAAVTNAATLYISQQPNITGGTSYAMWVDDGSVRLDGSLLLNGTAAPIYANGSAGSTGDILVSNGGATPSWTAQSSITGLPYIASTGTTTAAGAITLDMNSAGNLTFTDAGGGVTFTLSPNSTQAEIVIDGTAKTITTEAVNGYFFNTGVVQMNAYGAGTATFDASGNISSVSDGRLKFIERNYTAGLNEIMQLHPIVYKWRPESKMETEHEYAGLDAREVHDVMGDLATGINKDGYYSIQDRALIVALINAVQTQQKDIEYLKSKIK